MPKPFLSVFSTTYNHEKYIRKSIESVLAQKTSFNIEMVIGEDHSTDNTRSIILEYASKYPDIIKPVFQSQNVGAARNSYEFCYPQLRGKYVAILEGDDYWTDNDKLEKQVNFLESNPKYSICAHKVLIELPDNNFIEDNITNIPHQYEKIEDYARYGNYIHTPSVVFKKPESLPLDVLMNIPISDYLLLMLVAQTGDIHIMNETMAVYRVHQNGAHSMTAQNVKNRNWFLTFYQMIPLFEGNIKEILISRFLKMAPDILASKMLLSQTEKSEIVKAIANYDADFFSNLIQQNQILVKSGKSIRWNLENLKNLLKKKLK